MTAITKNALRHRKLVVLAWIVLAAAGVATLSSTTGKMTHTFATPGPRATTPITGSSSASASTATSSPRSRSCTFLRAVDAQRCRPGRRGAHIRRRAARRTRRVADYANTHNAKLISRDGRTTWALINMPNPDIPLGTGVMQRIPHVLRAAAPPGASVAVTGFEQLQTTGGSSGPSAFVETLIGMAGALVILALVFGSALAVVPLLMAIRRSSSASCSSARSSSSPA